MYFIRILCYNYIRINNMKDIDATWAFAVFNKDNILIYQNSSRTIFSRRDKNIAHKIELHAVIRTLYWFLDTEYKDIIICYDNNYIYLNTADSKNKD